MKHRKAGERMKVEGIKSRSLSSLCNAVNDRIYEIEMNSLPQTVTNVQYSAVQEPKGIIYTALIIISDL